jgi:N-acetylglucosamine-6-phosphate deacetylase
MEGPFISPEKKGAHDEHNIVPVDNALLNLIKGMRKFNVSVVIAPEYKGNVEKISQIKSYADVAIGHSLASADLTMQAIQLGANKIIHLYNAMSGFNHHNPGVVNAAFMDKHVLCELICDNVHVNPVVVRNSFDILTPKRIIIISDSLVCKGLKNGDYMLGTLPITKHNQIATLTNSETIAGSITGFDVNVRNMYNDVQCSLHDIVQMSSYNAARSFHQEHNLGVIEVGAKANFVLVNKKMHVLKTYINGKIVYQR